MKRLTDQMKAVLRHLRDGEPLDSGFPTYTGRLAGVRRQAHYGGLTRTLQGLRRRGLIEEVDRQYQLTEAGRKVASEAK